MINTFIKVKTVCFFETDDLMYEAIDNNDYIVKLEDEDKLMQVKDAYINVNTIIFLLKSITKAYHYISDSSVIEINATTITTVSNETKLMVLHSIDEIYQMIADA